MSLVHFGTSAAEFLSGISLNHNTGLFDVRSPDNTIRPFNSSQIPIYVQAVTEARQSVANWLDGRGHAYPLVEDGYRLVGVEDGRFVQPVEGQTKHLLRMPATRGNRQTLAGPFDYERVEEAVTTHVFHPFVHNLNMGHLNLRITEERDGSNIVNEIRGGASNGSEDPSHTSNKYTITQKDLSLTSLMTFLGITFDESDVLLAMQQAAATIFNLQDIPIKKMETRRNPFLALGLQDPRKRLTSTVEINGLRHTISLIRHADDREAVDLVIRLNINSENSKLGHVEPLKRDFQAWLKSASSSVRRLAA